MPFCPNLTSQVQKDWALVSSSSGKGTNSIIEAPPSGPYLNLMTFQKPLFLIPSHWGEGLRHVNGGGVGTYSQSYRDPNSKKLAGLVGCHGAHNAGTHSACQCARCPQEDTGSIFTHRHAPLSIRMYAPTQRLAGA